MTKVQRVLVMLVVLFLSYVAGGLPLGCGGEDHSDTAQCVRACKSAGVTMREYQRKFWGGHCVCTEPSISPSALGAK